MAERSPDVTLGAERSVLGGLMVSDGAWPPEVDLLAPGHFSCPVRCRIYRAILELHDAGEPIDSITVFGALHDTSKPPAGGWAVYLTELIDATPTAANVSHHAGLVLREARRRDYLEVFGSALNDARTPGADADQIATAASLRLCKIADGREVARPTPMRAAIKAELKDLEERRTTGTPAGAPTGFADLDKMICGLVPGHLIVLAGRPSMGKSSLARNILNRVCRTGAGGLLFTFEAGEQEIAQASLASEARINLQKIRTARLSREQYAALVEGAAALHSSGLAIVDRPGMAIAEIRNTVRAYAARNTIGVIAVDYMQLADGPGHNREQEIASVSRGLKALAKELVVPVIALSQLNRGLEKRDDKRPRLSDLRESGSIEQDADEVLLLYRDEYYNKSTKDPGVAELGVAKNRNGPTGMIKLRWLQEYTRFVGLTSGETAELF